MRAIAFTALSALALAAFVLPGCATRTQAPVVQRDTPPARPPSQGIAQADRPATYVVKRGDTLYSIARDNGIEPRELAAINNIDDPTSLRVGQTLVLARRAPVAAPAESGAVAVNPITTASPVEARPLGAAGIPQSESPAGTSPSAAAVPGAPGVKTTPKAVKLPYSEQNLALLRRGEEARPAQSEAAPTPDTPAQSPSSAAGAPQQAGSAWAWPAAGKVIGTFQQSGGKGVAIAGKLGDPIYASAAGTVVYSGEGLPSYGKLIIVKHSDEYLSVYAHNSEILVKEKQTVAKGQKIAEMGTSGTGAPSPRLHFEIRRLGKTVDPETLLPGRP